MSDKRKLKTLTQREKFDVINAVKSGMKKKDVAAHYGLPPSTLSTIIKNEAKILQRYESSSNLSSKRRRLAEKEVVRKLITDMEQQSASPINVLHAIRMTDKAWRSVSVTTISNCFKSCGFSMSQEEASEEPLEPDMSLEADWNKLQNTEVQFEDYVTCDEGLATTGTLTDAEIIDIVN
ncbi:hypothetical protein HHI36_015291 [Cryptolaemus montrouzieri]|uniref:HTH psq-type domain-containing protein n=1 Tax=Cryptolaemus montrouzieri TaxID=559131 RepID=A0ABD2N596_9CUCU